MARSQALQREGFELIQGRFDLLCLGGLQTVKVVAAILRELSPVFIPQGIAANMGAEELVTSKEFESPGRRYTIHRASGGVGTRLNSRRWPWPNSSTSPERTG